MELVVVTVAAAVAFVYLYLFVRSYWRGNHGLNGELFDR